MSEKQLLAFQVHAMLGPGVLFYAGSSSSIVTSWPVVFFCSASGPAGRMLVTVWRSASICSSVSRSSLSSTICRRKPPGLQMSLLGWATPCHSQSQPSLLAQSSGPVQSHLRSLGPLHLCSTGGRS